jgi:hypothetical protein
MDCGLLLFRPQPGFPRQDARLQQIDLELRQLKKFEMLAGRNLKPNPGQSDGQANALSFVTMTTVPLSVLTNELRRRGRPHAVSHIQQSKRIVTLT